MHNAGTLRNEDETTHGQCFTLDKTTAVTITVAKLISMTIYNFLCKKVSFSDIQNVENQFFKK